MKTYQLPNHQQFRDLRRHLLVVEVVEHDGQRLFVAVGRVVPGNPVLAVLGILVLAGYVGKVAEIPRFVDRTEEVDFGFDCFVGEVDADCRSST